jgi:uncharacterized protein (UPF0262 family)
MVYGGGSLKDVHVLLCNGRYDAGHETCANRIRAIHIGQGGFALASAMFLEKKTKNPIH